MSSLFQLQNPSAFPYIKEVVTLPWDTLFPNYESTYFPETTSWGQEQQNPGIIIDNGSYECRAGWSFSSKPNLQFRSLVAKAKISLYAGDSFIVGNKIFQYEQGKIHKKSPFERNLITHYSTQEHIFDHIFSNWNITDSSVNYPIVFTEPWCNLNISRKNINEMLFELYNVPSVSYAVDMLLSLYHSNKNMKNLDFNSLIISSSYQTTHILPVINGKININKARRLGIGSDNSRDWWMKSMQLKYPEWKGKFTNEIIQFIQENYTTTAFDYEKQLKCLEFQFKEEVDKYKEMEIISIFGSIDMYNKVNDSYITESTSKGQEHRRFSYWKAYTNLVEYNNSKQFIMTRKLNQGNDGKTKLYFFERPKTMIMQMPNEAEIKAKEEIKKEQSNRWREMLNKKREENFKKMQMELENLENIVQLKEINQFQFEEALINSGYDNFEELQKRMNKIMSKLNTNINNKEKEIDVEKRWPLLTLPDEDWTSEQIKMKRIQKMQKNAYLSRLEKRESANKEKERIELLKQKNPEYYWVSLYRNKKEIIDKLEKYKQIRKDMANRHSKTNIKRMQVLAELGKDQNSSQSSAASVDDDFGSKDEDWDIYREVSKNNLSEEEEEEQQRLNDIEGQIVEMDPDYYKNYQKNQCEYYMSNTAFSLGVDQFRLPELLMKPYLIGIEQGGIIEIIQQIFKTVSEEKQKDWVKNVFWTGGNTKYPWWSDRVEKELCSIMPVNSEINVVNASDPVVDAWNGGKDFYNDPDNHEHFITRTEYNEYGVDYFKEHFASNLKVNSK